MEKSRLWELKKKIMLILPLGMIIIALMLFLPAGSSNYWQAWLFLTILFVPFLFVVAYLLKHDPELLERRMRTKEKEAGQNTMIKLTQLLFFIAFLIPGFDYRYNWSNVPGWLVILSDILVFLGYMFIFLVFRENTYTSRIVEVEKKQKVISTGPYALVRHPMYAGSLLMYIFLPLALGSYVALIPIIPVVLFVVIIRISDEEILLLKELKGYKEYCKKVKYRLIPGIW
jgi:protein-S-isoprenylcysteine O-methyltransferase Ste14